jgi:hypothetical protein
MLIESNAVMWEPQQPGEPALAILDRLASDIFAVHLEQVEGVGAAVAAMAADQIERRQPVVAAISVDAPSRNRSPRVR